MKKPVLLFSILLISSLFLTACGKGFSFSSIPVLEGERLNPLNSLASKNSSQSGSSGVMYYSFTKKQRKNLFSRLSESRGSIALSVELEKNLENINSENQTFSFGFLTDEDFNDSGKLYSSLESRYLIQGDFSAFKKSIVLELAVTEEQFGDSIPAGFFVSCKTPFVIKKVSFEEARYGFDFSSETPVFAFGTKGGSVSYKPKYFDFTDAKNVFVNSRSNKYIAPYFNVLLSEVDDIGTYDKQKSAYIKVGSEKVRIRRTLDKNNCVLQGESFINLFSDVDFSSSKDQILSIMLNSNTVKKSENKKILEPIPSDLGLILEWNQDNWRTSDYELFKWDLFPEVLFFDFSTYEIQSLFLTRLAYFVEKEGYKGTFISDEDVLLKHGYNAHDYKAVDLAAFFTQAHLWNIRLNKKELLLKEILIANGIIVPKGDGTFTGGNGCLISISRESNTGLRYRLIAHEAWHGVFFGDADFRKFIDGLYDSFDERSLEYIKRYWTCTKDLSYDLNDDYLMRNEFMAYIMQQNLANLRQYIVGRSGWRNKTEDDYLLVDYIQKNDAEYFYEAGVLINDYVFNKWGFAAGRLSLISK